jgi:aminomethyltransferase
MYPVFRGGAQVGKVTSACYSPRLEKNIGYAMLPIALAEPVGQEFDVETPTGRHRGVSVRKPFIDPDKRDPQAVTRPAPPGGHGLGTADRPRRRCSR